MITVKYLAFIFLLTTVHVYGHPGIGIVQDTKGNIFYTDLSQVWKILPDGKKVVAVPDVHTHELFLDENDNLFGEHLWYNGEKANTWGHYVWKLTSQGRFEKVIPNTAGLLQNYSFVRDHFGAMYWTDRSATCQHLMRTGKDKHSTQHSNECFTNIRWMKAAADGSVYVIDLVDLKKVDQQGKVKTIASRIHERKFTQFHVDEQHYVSGIWDDKAGNIYTAIYAGRMVKKFDPDGTVEIVVETSIPWSPTGGMVDREGNLWLLEASVTNAVRVEKIMKDGKRVTF